MARDLSRNGIRVMTIAPGIFETPMLLGMPQEVQDALGKMVPVPHLVWASQTNTRNWRNHHRKYDVERRNHSSDGAIRMQPK